MVAFMQRFKSVPVILFASRKLSVNPLIPFICQNSAPGTWINLLTVSSGLLTVWSDTLFSRTVIHSTTNVLTLQFTCWLSSQTFFISNVYCPSNSSEKVFFVNRLKDVDTEALKVWLILGDFNLVRSSENRSALGVVDSEILIFNDLISSHNWIALPFTSRSFTRSNMQMPPLLVKLDWVFCSTDWLMAYPNSVVQPLSRPISDHVPYVTQFSSGIPRVSVFRFENYWADFASFMPTVTNLWNAAPYFL
jgi:hypothetical protein